MLRKSHQDHALAFTCDADGGAPEILHDAHGFLDGAEQDGILPFLTGEARTELLRFLSEVREQGHSMRKEVALSRNGREFPFSLFGIAKNGRNCIIAVQSPRHIFLIYDEFMSMINEQARSLREEQRKSARAGARLRAEDKGLLDDYMRLNNEMANMQRELSIANQTLQIQEKRFRDLVTFNPDAQIVLDDAGRILFCNPAAESILSLDGKESIGSVFALDMRGEREFCLKSAGKRTWVEIRHTDVTWEGRPAILFSLRDITERKQMEQFTDDVGRILQHDLVSPLNPIVSLPQLLMDDENITADQKRILDMISKAGMRMLNMIRLSLNLYKMEQGNFEFTPEPVDLVTTFRDIQADLSERTRARKVLVRIAMDDRPIMPRETYWVMAEPNLCYSMFSNLVLNAIEASPQGGMVTIELGHNGRARAAIRNEGVVPEEIRETFFEKYATFGKTQGTGLGTYSARLIAQTLGGAIRMETSEDDGTVVTVELPSNTAMRPGTEERVPAEDSADDSADKAATLRIGPGQAPLSHENRALVTSLHRELSLNSYLALGLACELRDRCTPDTPEHQAFEGIRSALDAFDFSGALSILGRVMQAAGIETERKNDG
jgi:signal transduction histidine kinase